MESMESFLKKTLSAKAYQHYLSHGVLLPVAGGKGGGGGTGTQVVKQEIDPVLKPFVERISTEAANLFGSEPLGQFTPEFFPGALTAGFNPLQTAAQQGAVSFLGGPQQAALNAATFGNAVGAFSPTASEAATAPLLGTGLGSIDQSRALSGLPFFAPQQAAAHNLSPTLNQFLSGNAANNPFFQSSVDAFANEATRQLNENVLPSIRSNIIASGGPSTRGDLVQGQAAGQTGSAIANFAAGLQQNAFNQAIGQQNLGAQLVAGSQSDLARQLEAQRAARSGELSGLGSNALRLGFVGDQTGLQRAALAPQLAGSFSQGILGQQGALSAVGAEQRALEQQLINDAIQKFNFEQNIDPQRLGMFSSFVTGLPGGSVSTQQNFAPQASGLQSGLTGALSGGLLAGGLQSAFPSLFQGAVGPLSAFGGPVGLAGGALLGGLLGAFG